MATYEDGRAAYRAWVSSPACCQFAADTPAEIAMNFFLPPVDQNGLRMAQPLPRDRQEWLRGFRDERAEATNATQAPPQ